jgi:hypothetical protein
VVAEETMVREYAAEADYPREANRLAVDGWRVASVVRAPRPGWLGRAWNALRRRREPAVVVLYRRLR